MKRVNNASGILVFFSLIISMVSCSAYSGANQALPESKANENFQRVLGLQGGENFRDFGGYPTRSGQRVKPGILFRTNQLDRFTADDYQRVNQLGVKLVVDFRDAHERSAALTEWQGNNIPHFLPLPMPSSGNLESLQVSIEKALETNASVDEMNKLAVQLYGEIPFEHADKYSQLLREIADVRNLPIIIHCAAGKDRTGLGVALIHSLLGVPREIIYSDFLMSNNYPLAEYQDLPKTDAYKLFLGVDQRWLQSSFDAIEQRYGSVENYIQEGLGIDADMRQIIRDNLLKEN